MVYSMMDTYLNVGLELFNLVGPFLLFAVCAVLTAYGCALFGDFVSDWLFPFVAIAWWFNAAILWRIAYTSGYLDFFA